MSEHKPHNYGLEPTSESPAARDGDGPRPQQVGIPRPAEVEPLPIEPPDDTPPPSSVKDLDICPNCGATMRGSDQLVCLRCGFDLKTMKPVETVVGETAVPEAVAEEVAEAREPIIQPGNGGFLLPQILAGASALILLIGFLAGFQGLFPYIVPVTEQGQPAVISIGARFSGLLRAVVLVGMQSACGMAALAFLAALLGRKTAATIEDLKLGAMRMLAIVLTMRLATFISLNSAALEWMFETIVQLGVFAGLSIALFRLKPRDAATLTGAALLAFVLLWLSAYAVIWAARV